MLVKHISILLKPDGLFVQSLLVAFWLTMTTYMQELWETALNEISDTETKARIQGIQSQMQCFKFMFCLVLTEMILRHTDKLSETFQAPKLSGVEGHEIAMLTVKTLKTLRTDVNFGKN